jgi:hypothetical protein
MGSSSALYIIIPPFQPIWFQLECPWDMLVGIGLDQLYHVQGLVAPMLLHPIFGCINCVSIRSVLHIGWS